MRRKNYIILLLITLFCGFSAANAQSITVEAETYTAATGGATPVVKENAGATIGYFDESGEMLTYSINIASAGYYQISFKYLSGDNGTVVVKTAKSAEGLISFTGVTYQGGWWLTPLANWPTTIIANSPLFYFDAGVQNLYLINKGAGFNVDFMTITKSSNQSVTVSSIEVTPSSLTVKPGRKGSVSAKALTSTGTVVAVPLTWSSNAPGGAYTAAATPSTDEITVTSGSVSTKVAVKVEMPSKKRDFVVTKHGQLHTSGKGLADKDNVMTSFAGPSWFWSCSSPKYWTADAVRYFVEDWHAGIVRLPMSIAPGLYNDANGAYVGTTWNNDNYFKNPEYAMKMMETMIDAAIENDCYIVVDFHEHWAHKADIKAKAVTFFNDIAKTYAGYPNIIYEIYNEPRDITSNSDVATYANEIIPVIRNYDKTNVIVVGSTMWSQQPGGVNGVNGTNIAYTLHYYATQHGTSLVGQLDCGRSVVVTECGADGGAQWDYINKCKANGQSHMTWSVNNKQTDGDAAWSAFITSNVDAKTWTDADLSAAGKNQKAIVKGWNANEVLPGPWTVVCTDNVISKITLVAPKTMVKLNEEVQLTVTGESTCQPVPVTNIVWSANAPGGKFKSATKGSFIVTATVGNLTKEVTIDASNDVPVVTTIKIEAESYTAEHTVVDNQYDKVLQKENGGLSIGYYNALNETVTYSVNVPVAGEYDVVTKYSSAGAGTLGLKVGTGAEQPISFAASTVPASGNWWDLAFASWPISAISKVTLPAGLQTITFVNKGQSINIDYFELTNTSLPTGIETVEKKSLEIYPNPSNGVFTINADNVYTVDVYDIMGNKVLSQLINNSENTIDLGNRKGLFLVKIYNNSESYIERVIVK